MNSYTINKFYYKIFSWSYQKNKLLLNTLMKSTNVFPVFGFAKHLAIKKGDGSKSIAFKISC